jgi:hypothetical protein
MQESNQEVFPSPPLFKNAVLRSSMMTPCAEESLSLAPTEERAPPGVQSASETVPYFAAEGLCNATVKVVDTESWSSSAEAAPVTYFGLKVCIGASSYRLRRRYKDFDLLYTNLCAAHGKHLIPALPPKQLLKNESAEFLQRRQWQLAEFLESVLSQRVLSSSAELCAFLECEAGSQLARTNAEVSTCAALLISELGHTEGLADDQRLVIDSRVLENEGLKAALTAAQRDRDAHKARASDAMEEAKAARAEAESAKAEAKLARADAESAKAEAKLAKTEVATAQATAEMAVEERNTALLIAEAKGK